MATFTAVGPRYALDGPLPVQPPNCLLNTPGVVRAPEDAHVFTGVNIRPYPSDVPSLWDPCSESGSSGSTKDTGTLPSSPTFDAFICYLPVECSMITYGAMSDEELLNLANRVLEATYSKAVEQALSQGVGSGSTNPWFGDTNMTALAGGAAVSPQIAMAYLEQAIGDTGRGGMIHVPPPVSARLQPFPLLNVSAEDPLLTIHGTAVVIGDGYIGAAPNGQTGPSAGKSWAFATGPVEVRVGDPLTVTQLRQTLDRSDNVVTFRAERPVLASWDTVLQAGVLVDWTATP